MKRFFIALVSAALLAAGLAHAQGLRATGAVPKRAPSSEPQAADYIVAVVNSEPITNYEVRSRLLRVEQQLARQGTPMPARTELTSQVLERLISERAQLQLAQEQGLKVDEAAVDQAEQSVARQNQLTVAQLRQRLAADALPLALFREDLRNQLLLSKLRDRELESRVRVSELDIDRFLRDAQSSDEAAAEEVNLAHILVAVPERAAEADVAAARAKAQEALARARAGDDFSALAKALSDSPTASRDGGMVGLRSIDRYPPLFVQAVRQLPEGGVSEVVRSAAGFHVVKVIERRRGPVSVQVTQSHARHILLKPSVQLSVSAARARLADFKRRVEAGQADFAQLAREHSQDGSARNGGDLGWANPGQFVPEFEEALSALAPGQMADPLISRFGVHLIQLLERREATLSEREQRDLARNLVREKKLDEAYTQWAQDVRGRAYVEYREPPQ